MDKKILMKYLTAFTYGDGSISQHGKECRFEATCIIDNMDYIEWRKSILEEVSPVILYEEHPEIKYPNRKVVIKTNTRTHPIYSEIRRRVYHEKVKTLDPHYLKLIDWEWIAILFMDDGTNSKNIRKYKDKEYQCSPTISIATMKFSYSDNLILKNYLKDNFQLEFNIYRRGLGKDGVYDYAIYLMKSSYERFIDGVSPYILPSFQYKLHPYDKPPQGVKI